MNKSLIILFFSILVVPAFSQDVHNLTDQFKYGSAPERVKACDELTRYYQAENIDSVRYFGQQLFFYGIDNHYYPAIEQGKLSLAVYYVFTGNMADGIALAKSLLQNMEERSDYRALSRAQGIIAIGYIHQRDAKSATYWSGQAKKSGAGDPNPEVRAESLMAVAEAAILSREIPTALKVYRDYVNVLKPLEKFRSLSAAYARMGDIYRSKGDLVLTEKYFNMSKIMAVKSGQKLPLAHALNNLAIVEFEKNNTSGALKLFTDALSLRKEIGDQKSVSESYYNLGDFYYYTEKPAEAEKYYRLSLETARNARLLNEVSDAFEQLGVIAKEAGDYPKAVSIMEDYIATQKALHLDEQADDEELADLQAELIRAETRAELKNGKFKMEPKSTATRWEWMVIALLGLALVYVIFVRKDKSVSSDAAEIQVRTGRS